jgi:hypothetical protein
MQMRRLLVVVPVLLFGLVACGTETDPVGTPPPPAGGGAAATATAGSNADPGAGKDPCSLVTVDEVGSALGGKAGAGQRQPGGLPGQQTCAFSTSGDSMVLATIGTVPGDAALFATLKTGMGAKATEVAGLGDAAVRDAGYMNVLKGSQILILSVNGLGSGDEVLASLTSLAKAALARL